MALRGCFVCEVYVIGFWHLKSLTERAVGRRVRSVRRCFGRPVCEPDARRAIAPQPDRREAQPQSKLLKINRIRSRSRANTTHYRRVRRRRALSRNGVVQARARRPTAMSEVLFVNYFRVIIPPGGLVLSACSA